MTVHRIVCESVDDHIRRSITEGTLPRSVDELRDEWQAEQALVGEGPESSDPLTAAKARDDRRLGGHLARPAIGGGRVSERMNQPTSGAHRHRWSESGSRGRCLICNLSFRQVAKRSHDAAIERRAVAPMRERIKILEAEVMRLRALPDHGRLRCNCPESGTSGSCPFHDAWSVQP